MWPSSGRLWHNAPPLGDFHFAKGHLKVHFLGKHIGQRIPATVTGSMALTLARLHPSVKAIVDELQWDMSQGSLMAKRGRKLMWERRNGGQKLVLPIGFGVASLVLVLMMVTGGGIGVIYGGLGLAGLALAYAKWGNASKDDWNLGDLEAVLAACRLTDVQRAYTDTMIAIQRQELTELEERQIEATFVAAIDLEQRLIIQRAVPAVQPSVSDSVLPTSQDPTQENLVQLSATARSVRDAIVRMDTVLRNRPLEVILETLNVAVVRISTQG
jgi:hypothetical protein